MTSYKLSVEADGDIDAITDYTVKTWGTAQAIRYIQGLHTELQKLADNPRRGRPFNAERPDYLLKNYEKHSIFYTSADDGIFVVRVLHSRMDFLRHL
jgi:toxin ParE1/3/4